MLVDLRIVNSNRTKFKYVFMDVLSIFVELLRLIDIENFIEDEAGDDVRHFKNMKNTV